MSADDASSRKGVEAEANTMRREPEYQETNGRSRESLEERVAELEECVGGNNVGALVERLIDKIQRLEERVEELEKSGAEGKTESTEPEPGYIQILTKENEYDAGKSLNKRVERAVRIWKRFPQHDCAFDGRKWVLYPSDIRTILDENLQSNQTTRVMEEFEDLCEGYVEHHDPDQDNNYTGKHRVVIEKKSLESLQDAIDNDRSGGDT